MIQRVALLLLILMTSFSFSQQIKYSDSIEISVLTCGSGEELYSSFGHSAFRIKDTYNHLDIVYNYGMFDFNAPNFYTNFAKGKLIYKLGRNRFSNFHEIYRSENRAVVEQVLNLTLKQKQLLTKYLEHNAQPENASYQYDFFYNNCATKIRAILEAVFPNQLIVKDDHITTSYTMRQLINNNVPYNTWANVGINIALGSVIDVKATTDEYQFLPEYIYKAFENTTINQKPLIKEHSTLVTKDTTILTKSNSLANPLVVFSILALIIIYITFKDHTFQKRTTFLDFTILFSTGLVGVLVLLLWLATNHGTTANNLNILWAFAPNLLVAFLMFSKNQKKWLRFYCIFLTFLMFTQAIVWLFKIEEFAIAMIPLFAAIMVRYIYLIKYFYNTVIVRDKK